MMYFPATYTEYRSFLYSQPSNLNKKVSRR